MKCKDCKGIDYCNQDTTGWIDNTIRCDYPYRGWSNTKLLKNDRFKEFDCDNKQDILNQLNETKQAYIVGPYGVGKTHFIYYVANKYNLQDKSVYVELFADSVRKVKEEMNSNSKHTINLMATVDILFIDDLGNEYSTEFIISDILQPIIDYRYLHNKPTIITSNYTLEELLEIYTQKVTPQKAAQIISRIKTFGSIEMIGNNRR